MLIDFFAQLRDSHVDDRTGQGHDQLALNQIGHFAGQTVRQALGEGRVAAELALFQVIEFRFQTAWPSCSTSQGPKINIWPLKT